MMTKTSNCAVIFGGNGFVGAFFAEFLSSSNHFSKIYILDNEDIEDKDSEYRKNQLNNIKNVEFIKCDVRNLIENFEPAEEVDLIANFAAIHREPGHQNHEYYETNLLGAENICKWASEVDCKKIIFTSSISPYGPSEKEKSESSIPNPTTAYGGSKLAAEKIHREWQALNVSERRLILVRPGVVFGPGEGGNVSRLIKAVLNRYFFYMGNKNTRKAGIYVKELCNAMWWVMENKEINKERIVLFNMSMNPGPTIEDYVNGIGKISNKNFFVPSIPYKLLLLIAYLIDIFAKPMGLEHPFSPVRIKKLVNSNNINPDYLVSKNYKYLYNLEEALSDWKKECPEEWPS